MEKEYVEALLKDIKKAYTPIEKIDTITTFVTLLSEYQNKTTQAIETAAKHLTDISNTFITLNNTNEILFNKILDIEKRVYRLELNFNIPTNDEKTEIEHSYQKMYDNQAEILKIVNKSLESKIKSDEDEIKIHEHIQRIIKDHIKMSTQMRKLVDRIEKLEDR